jgi:GT2 family glycosyltransferase
MPRLIARRFIQLSICICTRDRVSSLMQALESCEAQREAIREVIVADDSSASATREAVERAFPWVRWVPGPKRGLGANRNAALDAATGTHVLFLDDDAKLGERFLDATIAALEAEDAARTIVTGVETKNGIRVAPNNLGFFGHQTRPYRPGEPFRTVVINSTVWPRALFDDVRFDEKLRFGSDEVDIASGAIAHGYRIVFAPEAVNLHEPDPLNRETYEFQADVSRLFVTGKRLLFVQPRPLRAFAFLILAPMHLLAAAVKRDGPAGVGQALKVLRAWGQYALTDLRDRVRQ